MFAKRFSAARSGSAPRACMAFLWGLASALVANGGAPVGAAAQAGKGVEVKIQREQEYQTILGWGKTTPWLAGSALVREQSIEQAVNDFGINRLRFEGLCGNSSGRRSWEWLNDNDDPHKINWEAFNTAQLDARASEWLLPWKKAVESRGEKFDLYVSPSFFQGGSSGDLPPWMLADPEEYAEWAEALLRRLRDKHGIEADWYCICNEAGNNNRFSPALVSRCAKVLMPRLRQRGFRTRLQHPESVNAHVAWRYMQAVRDDPDMWKWIGLISYHWYGRDNQSAMVKLRDLARQREVPTAQTEFMDLTIDHLYDDLVLGGVSYWEVYGLVGPNYQAAASRVSSTTFRGGRWYWRFRQVSHYVRPGAVRVGCESGDDALRCLAFLSKGKPVVVLINTKQPHAERKVKIAGLSPGSYGVSRCVGPAAFEELGLTTVGRDGELTVAVAKDSVLTVYPHDGKNRPPAVTEWRATPDFLHVPRSTTKLSCRATDPEGDSLSYAWSVVRQPDGARASLATPATATALADGLTAPGEYLFAVQVADGTNTVRREVLLKVFQGNQPPVAMDVHNRIPVWVRVADGGTLLRAGAWDVENDRTSFGWTVVRQPAGAQARLESPHKPACRVRGMTVAGDYVFRLTLGDGTNTVTVDHTVPVYP